jgi:type I restriction enzyme, S subunit
VTQLMPSAMPPGWNLLTMGELGRWFGGGTPSKANPRFWTDGNIPWVSPKDMKRDLITDTQDHITEEAVAKSATTLVEEGSVLIVVRSGILQHTLPVAVAKRQVTLNQDLKAVKPRESIHSDYLALALKAFERDILHSCRKAGTTVQSLELPAFLRFEIPVAPVDEQRRIVSEIEKQFTRLEVGVAALRRVQGNLKRYRAAVLKAACEGRLVPSEAELAATGKRKINFESGEALLARVLTDRRQNWRGRGKYKEPLAADITSLPTIPKGWTWATLDQLCPLFADSVHRTPKYGAAGVPALGPRDVVGGELNLNTARLVNETEFAIQTARHVPQDGDIVYSRELSLGWGAVVPKGQRLCLSQGMCLFRPHEAVNLRYFLGLLNGPIGRRHADNAAIGSAHPHINLGDIKAYTFPLPPLAEQTRIVTEVERRLSIIEESAAVASANLSRSIRLRQSVLRAAFTGKLFSGVK